MHILCPGLFRDSAVFLSLSRLPQYIFIIAKHIGKWEYSMIMLICLCASFVHALERV